LPAWAARTAVERAALLMAAAGRVADLGLHEILIRETGKVMWEAHAEAGFYPMCVDAFSAMAPAIDAPEILFSDGSGTSKLFRDPVGVVGATIAWNWPIALAAGKFVPALIAGNTLVLKPSPVAPLATLMIVQALNEVLPPGVINSVSGEDLVVGSALFNHPDVRMTAFTGGTGGGRAAAAAGASSFTRMLLELGGNDPAIVLDDQPITPALCAELALSAFLTSGQQCVDIKRVYAPQDKVAELADGIGAFLDAYVVGDGFDPASTIGPVTTDSQWKRVRGLVEAASAAGGAVRAHGSISGDEAEGFFLKPTIVTGLPENHPLVAEEQFGPVLPIQGYESVAQGIEFANGTDFGLTASVWSPDVERAEKIARQVQAGGTFINVHGLFAVNPALPFGGVKLSGLGREYGMLGFEGYTEPHVVSSWRAPVPS